MSNKRLLLLSNGSELIGDEPTEFAQRAVRDFIGAGVRRVLFVPFAAVVRTYAEYAARVRARFGALGCEVESLHEASDAEGAVARAEAIAVGGGNTFHLLRGLYEAGAVEGGEVTLVGARAARIFLKGEEPRELSPAESFSFLLR
jgi:dipeptidase E